MMTNRIHATAVVMILTLPLVLSGCGDHGGSGAAHPQEGTSGSAPSGNAPATLPGLPPQQSGSGSGPAPSGPQAQPGSPAPANGP